MARMIPPGVPEDCPSEGEREVFMRLRDDPGTNGWTVLHSVGLAKHDRQVAGELDFVVIIPELGVLCLEVKGCSTANLRREDGKWFYGPRDKGEPRGPFRQASDGMHSLKRQLLASHPELDRVQFSSGVIFPFAVFKEESPEWHRWEVIDARAFAAPISVLLSKIMRSWRAHFASSPGGPRIQEGSPTADQCSTIRNALRADFEIPIDPRSRSSRLEAELIRYTEEQFTALDAMSRNPRAIFEGPAGSGKTLLAMEAARRAKAAGRRVLFVCFNRFLGSWLEARMADAAPRVVTTTAHRRMLAVAGLNKAPEDADSDYWETRLPLLAGVKLLEAGGEGRAFDELIVDEAQDLLRVPYLDFLDFSLRGGLAAGRWRMFGDFEKQAIFEAANMSLDDFRASRCPDAPVFSLRVNCRNTPLVAEWVHILGGLDPRYSRVLRPDDRVRPTLDFYKDDADQKSKLVQALEDLERHGFEDEEIVILSPRSEASCLAASLTTPPWNSRLRPLSHGQPGKIGFASIHSFKGLESPAVIVTDIESIASPAARSLFYVALTRAVQRIVLLANRRVRDEANQIMLQRPSNKE